MPEGPSKIQPAMDSATRHMMEALDKASVELDKSIRASTRQLQDGRELLLKNFSLQLSKLFTKTQVTVDSAVDDITARKNDVAQGLCELERLQKEHLSNFAQDFRNQVTEKSGLIVSEIAQFLEDELTKLKSLIEQSDFAEAESKDIENFKQYAQQNKAQIEASEQECKLKLSSAPSASEERLKTILKDTKEQLDDSSAKHDVDFEEQIKSVIERLNAQVSISIKELNEQIKHDTNQISEHAELAASWLAMPVNEWQTKLLETGEEFTKSMVKDKNSFEELHFYKLDQKSSAVQSEIEAICQSSVARMTASHTLLNRAIERLEKKYLQRVEKLLSNFESALAQERKLPTGSTINRSQASQDLKELLHKRLKSRGEEIAQSFKKQLAQFDAECTRLYDSAQERLETVRAGASESFDKQSKNMELETDRILKSFYQELDHFGSELPQIEDTGRAAALAVMAYRSAMLSFGTQ